jgi:hypothetical protein
LQAGLGAGFFGLIAIPEFQAAAAESISVSSLLFLAIGTLISTMLIVPLHLRVTGEAMPPEQPATNAVALDRPLAQLTAFMRPAAVFFVLLFVQYVHGAIEETIRHAHWAVAILTFGIVVAGIVTYYWVTPYPVGGLATGAASVPTVTLGTFCCLPFIAGIMYLLGGYFGLFSIGDTMQSPPGAVGHGADAVFLSVGLVVFAGVLSVLAASLLFWSFSRLGEWVIRNWPPETRAFYPVLGCCLIGAAILLQCGLALGIFLATGLRPSAMGTFGFLFFPIIAGGWLLGLIIGDFSSLLAHARPTAR